MAKFYWHAGKKNWASAPDRRSRRRLSPAIHSDVMHALYAPFDGKLYDSKSQMNAAAKARGLECVGNDSSFLNPAPRETQIPDGLESDLRRAIQETLK